MFFVYEVQNTTTEEVYVGMSIHPEDRLHEHALGKKSASKPLHKAIKEYGIDTFKLSVFSRHRLRERAFAMEVARIKELKDQGVCLYNIAAGGLGSTGRELSDATKLKIAQSLRGKAPSKATRAKMSKSHTGVRRGPYKTKAVPTVEVVCQLCGKKFLRRASTERWRSKNRTRGPFCSPLCKNKTMAAVRWDNK